MRTTLTLDKDLALTLREEARRSGRPLKRVVNETLRGTGTALRSNGVDADALMTAVASPGGLTERALQSFDESGLQAAVDRAVATVLGQ